MLQNKTAYITGGSRGIGFGIAKSLLSEGMHVAISSRTQEGADKAADHLAEISDSVLALKSDVRNLEDEMNAIDKIMQTWGHLDVVISNAGVGHFATIDNMTPEQWRQTIDINLTGAFHTVKASIDALKASRGYLFTIASLAGTNFFKTGAAYNASKFGLVGFTQAVMLDLRHHGIKVTTIMPGSVSTEFNNRIPSEKDAWKIQTEDLGKIVVDLLKMNPRTLPSKVEVRPSIPPQK